MRKLIFLLILIASNSEICFAYPTTIAKGYKTCGTCHISNSGGQLLTEYGRAMSADFMSTFSFEGEGDEFGGDNGYIDYGIDYRHLFVITPEQTVEFPMLIDFDLALHLGRVSVSASYGLFSRERNPESRENWIQLRLPRKLTLRTGYFMPVLGINTNDHSLAIKRNAGLSRGSEQYNLELHHLTKYTQMYYTLSVPEFKLADGPEAGFYDFQIPPNSQTHFLRASVLLKRTEIGGNFVSSENINLTGVFAKTGLIKNTYAFLEYDYNEDQNQMYARVGGFLFRGFDTYVELDRFENRFGPSQNLFIGLDWMIRPRFELSFKINLSEDKPHYIQNHLWL